MLIALSVIIFLSGAVLSSAITWKICQKRPKKDDRELTAIRRTYLRVSGTNERYGDYDLRSFDGGRRWYATHTNAQGQLIIDGDIEDVYPGLRAELENWDNIVQFVCENGTIGLDPDKTEDSRAIFENLQQSIVRI
jgi:hypothetical protein